MRVSACLIILASIGLASGADRNLSDIPSEFMRRILLAMDRVANVESGNEIGELPHAEISVEPYLAKPPVDEKLERFIRQLLNNPAPVQEKPKSRQLRQAKARGIDKFPFLKLGPGELPNGLSPTFFNRDTRRICTQDPTLWQRNPTMCDNQYFFGSKAYDTGKMWDNIG